MSKYQPLTERLKGHPADEWRAQFTDIEEVLGFALPKSARAGRTWWNNDPDKPHSRAWSGHGWEAHDVDPGAGAVTFRRSAVSPAVVEAVAGLAPIGDLSAVDGPEAAAQPAPPAVAAGDVVPSKPTPLPAALITLSAAFGVAILALAVRRLAPRR